MTETASRVQPWLASRRIAMRGPTASRTEATRCTSVDASVPTFILSVVKPAATRSRAVSASAEAAPADRVTSVVSRPCMPSGRVRAGPPHSVPSARATRSCRAASTAALASKLRATARCTAPAAAREVLTVVEGVPREDRREHRLDAGGRARQRLSVTCHTCGASPCRPGRRCR